MTMDTFPLLRGPLPEGTSIIGGWRVTSYFGARLNPLTGRPGNHGGMDLAHSLCYDAPIIAPCAGRVSQGWDSSGGGNWTNLVAADGSRWGFGHACRFEEGVNGRHVEAGAVLAHVGSTGASTGAHLHLAWAPPPGGRYDDPYDQLNAAAARDAFAGQPERPAMDDEGIRKEFEKLAQGMLVLETSLVDTTSKAVYDRFVNARGDSVPVFLDPANSTWPVNLTFMLQKLKDIEEAIGAISARLPG